MSVFVEILNLLSGPTGGMAYHLILLFCIWAIVGLALSRLSRREQGGFAQPQLERLPRILLAGSMLSLCRFLLIAVALLDRQDGVSLVRLGPPLERFVDTLSALLICSAFVLPSQKKTLNRLLVGTLGLFTLGLYVIAAFQWADILNTLPSALYNRSVQRWAWELWQLAFLIPAFVYVLIGPLQERDALGASLGVLVFAHVVQAVYPLANQIPHAAGWVRLANLIAFPLLGVSTYLLIFQQLETEAAELQAINEQSLAQITHLMSLLELNAGLYRSLDLNTILESAVRTISEELQCDLCALALTPARADLHEKAETTELELAVVFDPPDVSYAGTRFSLQDYPVIQHVMTRNRPAILGSRGPAGYDVSASLEEIAAILRLLGNGQPGAVIVQPIESDTDAMAAHENGTQVIGAMLACRTGQGHTFTLGQAQKSESLATYLGAAIKNARRYHHAQARIEQLIAIQHALETEHVRTKTDLENRLQKSQEQAAAYMQRMYEAERAEQQAQKDVHQVHIEMARLRQESQQEIAHARHEVRRGIQHTTRLTQRIAELDAERIQLNNLLETLQMEQETLQLRLAMRAYDQSDMRTVAQPQAGETSAPDADLATDHLTAEKATAANLAKFAALLDDLAQPAASLFRDTERLANGAVSKLDSEQRTLFSRVRANAERLSFMLGNLAILRDIHAGRLTPEPAPTDISRLIKRALDNVRFRLEQRQLRTRLAIGAVPVVQVDPGIVQGILDNQLDQLCSGVQHGTTIGIQAFMEDREDRTAAGPTNLHIALSGTGTRIRCPAVEEPLTGQSEPEDTSEIETDIVQALAQAHGGRTWCVGQPGTDTTFHLTIPVGPADVHPGGALHAGEKRG